MPRIRLTRHLLRYFPGLTEHEAADGRTVAELVAALDARFPGIAAYIVDEQGAMRKHVNIFVGRERIHDRQGLSDPVGEDDQVHILQALSGG